MVKFTAFARIHLEEPQKDIPLHLSLSILPPGHGEDDAHCEIELNFMSATGTVFVSSIVIYSSDSS